MSKQATRRAVWVMVLMAWGLAAQAASIGTGLFGRMPHVIGVVTPGDAEEVARDFADPLKQPLAVSIDPQSHPLELMKIGLWMRERQPELALRDSCVGACAKSILMSGKVRRIEPGTVIAFGGLTESMARRKDQIDAGELFIQGDELGEASRDRFLQQYKAAIDTSLAVRAMRAPLPPQVQAFMDATFASWKTVRQTFGMETRFTIAAGKHRCMWWVPDAEGLQQLGLEVPDYQPASRADVARLLKVPETYIYVGPALSALPEQPLCPGQKGFNFPPLP